MIFLLALAVQEDMVEVVVDTQQVHVLFPRQRVAKWETGNLFSYPACFLYVYGKKMARICKHKPYIHLILVQWLMSDNCNTEFDLFGF